MTKEFTVDEIVEMWASALESGEYEQGKEHLCRNNTYCCLGVLCELAIKNGVPIEKTLEDDNTVLYNNRRDYLPNTCKEWAHIKCCDGTYDGSALYKDNDRGKTFKQIAQIIRAEKDNIFKQTA